MNRNNIFSFLVGVILTVIVMLLLFNRKADISTQMNEIQGELEGWDNSGDVQGIKDVWEIVKSEAKWLPEGSVTASDVLEGKTFYNRSRDIQTGTYTPEEFEFLGDASVEDVLTGNKFYSDSGELLTGTLVLPSTAIVSYKGNALVSDVLAGKTFYSNSGTLKTGTYTPPSVSYLGDASVTDVMLGKKFYSNSGTLLTGTYTPPTPIDFTNLQYSTYDDYAGIDYLGWEGILTEDYKGEEAQWSKVSDDIWKDERAGLYWSSDQTNTMLAQEIPNTNEFSAMSLDTCDYFNSVPRSSYDGSDLDCGNAINWCATLTLDGRSNWYLPSQKELMLAYIDGMYNQAGNTLQEAAEFAVGDGSAVHYGYYWSSSEVSGGSTHAWSVRLAIGSTGYDGKGTTGDGVRCVSRD